MSARRILITGGDGFVGRYLVRAIAAHGSDEVIVGSRHAAVEDAPGPARQVQLDVTDADQTRSVIAAVAPTHLVHLAAITAVPSADRSVRLAWSANATGTLNVALAILESAPECRLLYCSSAEVYGGSFAVGHALSETAPLEPVNFYGTSKAAADLLIGQMARQGLRAVRLRPFNHTGAGQSDKFVVPAFAAQIARIERGEQTPEIQVGNLASRRDFLDVRDVVQAYLQTIIRFDDLPNGCVMNIASGNPIAIRAILDILLSLSSKIISVTIDPQRLRGGETMTTAGDASLARRLLGWEPGYDITATMQSVLDSFRVMQQE